ncbi:alpha-L-rhamnosidase C-terminal domain-containing protein [Larkinella insperata]|uniref:Alpha-L-rhamnosidase C-terminal domain-containing protein n=1 Tax=Larkinella insperata TaxID=332158 RepID=A0ABW3Q7D1_9BACT
MQLFVTAIRRLPWGTLIHRLFLVILLYLVNAAGKAQLKEPYQPLHGGSFKPRATVNSPDPIIHYQWTDPKASDSLQIYPLFPKQYTASPSGSFRFEKSSITVLGTGEVAFDFGQVNAGWVEFDSEDLPGEVTVSISEYREPAILNAGAQHPVKTLNPVRYGHTYRLELNTQLYEGVRFVWLHVKTFNKPWKLSNFRLVCQTKPVNYRGSFHSSDPLLNRIWYTGAYTVKLNLLQDYLGAILMERSDRHSWTGDAYPSQAASLVAFGNFDFVRKNIAFTAPQDNGIAAYSMYWVLGLVDYFTYTGDTAFFRTYLDNASQRLEKAFRQFDALPNLGFMGWDERLGAGFERPQIAESQHAYRWLCINAWSKFSQSLLLIGDTARAAIFSGYATLKRKQLTDEHLATYGVHALAEVFNAGTSSSPTIQQLSAKWFKNRQARLSYSPFNQYFILQGMARAGYLSEALTTVKDQWGGQIQYGGTTFFEVFRPSWNTILAPNSAPVNNQCGYTSLTHPWGAGVTRWLSEEILGIRALSPGFKTFSVIPYLTDSLTSVTGSVPTPQGIISAAFNSVTGNAAVLIPAGTQATKVGLPKNGRLIRSITVNHKPVKAAAEDAAYAYLQNLAPGSYTIKIQYGKALPIAKASADPLQYAITDFEQDSTTSGNWKNRYGKDGYFLPGATNTDDRFRKPAYIDSLPIIRAVKQSWPAPTTDPRALQLAGTDGRLVSALVTQDPKPTLQTFTLDVYNQRNEPYDLTLYFLDGDRQGRRSAIEVFDANTLEILAPVQLIDRYGNGKYIRFQVDRSIRVRINHVRGPNAALAGIFFN